MKICRSIKGAYLLAITIGGFSLEGKAYCDINIEDGTNDTILFELATLVLCDEIEERKF